MALYLRCASISRTRPVTECPAPVSPVSPVSLCASSSFWSLLIHLHIILLQISSSLSKCFVCLLNSCSCDFLHVFYLIFSTYLGQFVHRFVRPLKWHFRISILSVSLRPHKSSRRHCGGRHWCGHGCRSGGGQLHKHAEIFILMLAAKNELIFNNQLMVFVKEKAVVLLTLQG